MDFLSPFYTPTETHTEALVAPPLRLSISAKQGNDFAKQVANDFNPIHDTQSKRFCVPGDLLFALTLSQCGIAEKMEFQFAELVKADSELIWPTFASDQLLGVRNHRDKDVLKFSYHGDRSQSESLIEQLIRHYVVFSGQNFPHILVPLMREHGVMFNPARPLVIYERMALEFTRLDFIKVDIRLATTTLDVNGKRGDAWLNFDLLTEGEIVGQGRKKLVLSGLREYDEQAVQSMCDAYEAARLKAA